MSSIAPSARLGWRLLPAVIAAALAVITASVAIAVLRDHPIATTVTDSALEARGSESGSIAVARKWVTHAYPVGADGRLAKPARVRFDNHKARLKLMVRDLSDALVIQRDRLPRTARKSMTDAAAGALVKQAPGMPRSAQEITIVKREARIGIQAPRFAAGSAEVRFIMRATINDRVVKWRDDYTFWLQRTSKRWHVIAFDVSRAQS